MSAPDIRTKRTSIEIEKINKGTPNHGISIQRNADNLYKLEALLPGPKDSCYEKGIFKLSIDLGPRYPFVPPLVKFLSPVPFHPNIDESGHICLDVLRLPPGSYNPALTLESIILSVQLLLSNPNPDDPLRADAADEFRFNPILFAKKASNFV